MASHTNRNRWQPPAPLGTTRVQFLGQRYFIMVTTGAGIPTPNPVGISSHHRLSHSCPNETLTRLIFLQIREPSCGKSFVLLSKTNNTSSQFLNKYKVKFLRAIFHNLHAKQVQSELANFSLTMLANNLRVPFPGRLPPKKYSHNPGILHLRRSSGGGTILHLYAAFYHLVHSARNLNTSKEANSKY